MITSLIKQVAVALPIPLSEISVKPIRVPSRDWDIFVHNYSEFGCLSLVPDPEDLVLGAYVGERLIAGSILSSSIDRYTKYSEFDGDFHDLIFDVGRKNVCSIYGFWRSKNMTRVENLAFLKMIYEWGRHVDRHKFQYVLSGSSNLKLVHLYRQFKPLHELSLEKPGFYSRSIFLYKTSDAKCGIRYYFRKTSAQILNKSVNITILTSKLAWNRLDIFGVKHERTA
jgi:hypothetical protein